MTATVTEGNDRLIALMVGGKPELSGKVIWRGRWLYYRDRKPSQIMRFCNGLSVDQQLLAHLEACGVEEIHYAMQGGPLYVAPVGMFRARGIPRAFNGRPQWILPLQYWRELPKRDYALPRIPPKDTEVVG